MSDYNVDLIKWLKSKNIDISRVDSRFHNLSLDSALFNVYEKYPNLFDDFLKNVYKNHVKQAKENKENVDNLKNYAKVLEQEIQELREEKIKNEEDKKLFDFVQIFRETHELINIIPRCENAWKFATPAEKEGIKSFLISTIKNMIDFTDGKIMEQVQLIVEEKSFRDVLETITYEVSKLMEDRIKSDPDAV